MRKLEKWLVVSTIVVSIIAAIVSFIGGDIALGNTYVIISYLFLGKIRTTTGKINVVIDVEELMKSISNKSKPH